MAAHRTTAVCTIVGGVASPLLSVIYMNRFLKHWRLTGRGEAFRAHVIAYADDVRHITRRWIPFAERRGLEDMTPGPTAYPAAKVKGDRSMPSKRERSEDADDPVPQGPRDTVRTELFEPQPPTMQGGRWGMTPFKGADGAPTSRSRRPAPWEGGIARRAARRRATEPP